MKSRQRSLVIVVVAMLGWGLGSAEAGMYSVPLPEFVGELQTYPNESVALFDFGTNFVDIYQVRIQVAGTFTTGLGHGDGVEIPEDHTFVLIPYVGIYTLDPDPGFASTEVFPSESPFVMDEAIDYLGLGATWDFLLDGTGEVIASLGWEGGGGWVTETEPTVTLTDAHLVIEGMIPEPGTALLVVCGGSLFLRLRRRKVGRTRMR